MNNNVRYILAGILIFLIILIQPVYLKWLGYESESIPPEINSTQNGPYEKIIPQKLESPNVELAKSIIGSEITESFITLITPLYTATISNRAGGTFDSYTLTQISDEKYKYKGGYDENGLYNSDIPVSLILSTDDYCQPCLAVYDDQEDKYNFINDSFRLVGYSDSPDTVFLTSG